MSLSATILRVMLALCWVGSLVAQTLPSNARFVMSHFKSDGGGGDERLYVSWSADGFTWTAINGGNPVWQPPGWAPFGNVVRDPAIVFANGFYWVCYTQGNYGAGSKFGLVRSSDLLNWTQVGPVDVQLSGATNPLTWSPSFFVDGDGSAHVFVAVNSVGGSQYNPIPSMRIYETHPLDANWTLWSPVTPVGLPETNTNEFFCWKEGSVYHAVYIDFGRGGAIVHGTSSALLTGWSTDRVLGYNSQEGPFVLPKPEGGYRLYVEPGNQSGSTITTYRWSDFDGAFGSATAQSTVTSSVPMRNGKPCAAHGALSFATWQSQQLASVPVAQQSALADADGDGLANLLEHALGTSPTLFTPADRRPQSFARMMGDGTHGGIRFDWFPSSADVEMLAETRLGDGSWSGAASAVAVESQTLQSDGTVRTFAHAASPGTAAMLRVRATQSAAAAPPPVQTLGVKVMRKRAKPAAFRKSSLP